MSIEGYWILWRLWQEPAGITGAVGDGGSEAVLGTDGASRSELAGVGAFRARRPLRWLSVL